MSFLKTFGAINSVKDILQINKTAGAALVQFHQAVLREQSELSEGQRELIAAYVSGINSCNYCQGVHSVTAEAFGIDKEILEAVLLDISTAPIEDNFKPLLRYARQLTIEPSKMSQSFTDEILDAGWSEQAVHDLVYVVCLFNFMNRLVEGHGVVGSQTLFENRGKALYENGYNDLLSFLKED